MTPKVRLASTNDLSAVAELTRRSRRQKEAWEPGYFRAAADADATHEEHLAGLLGSDEVVVRVATFDDEVVGCALSLPQRRQWFVDDVAAADEGWWSDAMVELLRAVTERPAVTCVPTKDVRQVGCCTTLGLRKRSSYWRIELTDGAGGSTSVTAVEPPEQLPGPPPHAFPAVDPAADSVTVLGDTEGGHAVLLPGVSAPPVYDPGGTTGLVERVTGGRRAELVDAAISASSAAGDGQLVVVCGEDDPALEDVLVDSGFSRVVDVYSWPERRFT